MEENFAHIAIENLRKHVGFNSILLNQKNDRPLQREEEIELLEINIHGQRIIFTTQIKREIRNQHLHHFIQLAQDQPHLLLIAERIFPNIKKELRLHKIAYLESSGNMYIELPEVYVWIDGLKNVETKKNQPNRAFAKTGLKMLFHLLIKPEIIQWSYREISNYCGISLGNVTNVIHGLQKLEVLKKLNNKDFIIDKKEIIIQKWISAYEEKIKSHLFIGQFRMRTKDFDKINLAHGKSFWGGEPAANILTNYIQPEEFIMYTTENRSELIKQYDLVPDVNGNLFVYKKFWNADLDTSNVVPPLLIYADLINKNDRRCIQTAEKIKNEYL
jgi:hypothetical protein